MTGKVIITVQSETLSTEELEHALQAEIGHIQEYGFSNLNEATFDIIARHQRSDGVEEFGAALEEILKDWDINSE